MLIYFRFHSLVDHYRSLFPELEVDCEAELAVYKVSLHLCFVFREQKVTFLPVVVNRHSFERFHGGL